MPCPMAGWQLDGWMVAPSGEGAAQSEFGLAGVGSSSLAQFTEPLAVRHCVLAGECVTERLIDSSTAHQIVCACSRKEISQSFVFFLFV